MQIVKALFVYLVYKAKAHMIIIRNRFMCICYFVVAVYFLLNYCFMLLKTARDRYLSFQLSDMCCLNVPSD